jgi:hypothetical protein
MSDRVTWATCPGCGERAALGWMLLEDSNGAPVGEVLVEVDCPNGCQAPGFMQLTSAREFA